jgi:hypothetical protein
VELLVATALIGVGIGLVSGALGKGGSALATPLLHGAGASAMVAVASPLPAVVPATWLASRPYARAGHVDARVLRWGTLVGVPATVAGAWATRWIPGGALVLATDAVVLVLGVRMLGRTALVEDGPEASVPSGAKIAAVVGVVGIVSGLLANGGGFLLVPLFAHVLRMPLRRALGTSLVLATVLAVPGTAVHAALGHVDWAITAAFGVGAVPLAAVGARIALRVRERTLTLAYGAATVTLAAGLLVTGR